jgi:hypothetical protein
MWEWSNWQSSFAGSQWAHMKSNLRPTRRSRWQKNNLDSGCEETSPAAPTWSKSFQGSLNASNSPVRAIVSNQFKLSLNACCLSLSHIFIFLYFHMQSNILKHSAWGSFIGTIASKNVICVRSLTVRKWSRTRASMSIGARQEQVVNA